MSTPAIEFARHTVDEVVEQLKTSSLGLSDEEAKRRLDSVGRNVLPSKPRASLVSIFGRQFRSSLIYLLLIAALISVFLGDIVDAVFILVVLIINAAIGAYHEFKAEKTAFALQSMIDTRVNCLRNGFNKTLPATELVPGDIIFVEAGTIVPADTRLVHSFHLETNESLLTGESVPIAKSFDWMAGSGVILGDCRNTLFAGSSVTKGKGKGIVVATGVRSEIGSIAAEIQKAEKGRAPIVLRMEKFSKAIAIVVCIISLVLVGFGIFSRGYDVAEMALFAVALAVSAIPEGLPVALTVALAIAANKMLSRGVIVRSLPAVEALGSCTLIATDKTGTLTRNEQTVQRIVDPSGERFEVTGVGFEPEGEVVQGDRIVDSNHSHLSRLARAAVLCNDGQLYIDEGRWKWRGDPTDVALLSLAHKLKWSRESAEVLYSIVDEIPFDSENQYAAVLVRSHSGSVLMAKGAPEVVFGMCRKETDFPRFTHSVRELAEAGFRTVAVADLDLKGDGTNALTSEILSGMHLVGLVGIKDPLRDGVRESIQICMESGITVFMLTGDHPVTASSIGKELGLIKDFDEVLNGREIDAMSEADFVDALGRCKVFARITPHQKLNIVRKAQQLGHFVAVTGDGVNDTPALHTANIGVAMGASGTDTARSAAGLVITDDNFSSIVAGIEEGRIAYANIRKIIMLLISTGCAEIIMVTLALIEKLPLPLYPIHLLWLNLVTNGIQDIALAFEPGEPNILRAAPRKPSERIFNAIMIRRILLSSVTMGCVSFYTYTWILDRYADQALAQSSVLMLMVFFENVHIGNCRSESVSAFKLSPIRSPVLVLSVLIALGIHLLASHFEFTREILQIVPIPIDGIAVLLVLSFTVVLVVELDKLISNVLKGRVACRK